jgi:hypothetical protein
MAQGGRVELPSTGSEPVVRATGLPLNGPIPESCTPRFLLPGQAPHSAARTGCTGVAPPVVLRLRVSRPVEPNTTTLEAAPRRRRGYAPSSPSASDWGESNTLSLGSRPSASPFGFNPPTTSVLLKRRPPAKGREPQVLRVLTSPGLEPRISGLVRHRRVERRSRN